MDGKTNVDEDINVDDEIDMNEEMSVDNEITKGSQKMHVSSIGETDDVVNVPDQQPVHAKGTAKQFVSGQEQTKVHRLCASCQRHGHDSHTCPLRMKAWMA